MSVGVVVAIVVGYVAMGAFTGGLMYGNGNRFDPDEAVVCGMIWPVVLVVFIAHGVRKLWRRREKVSVPKARVVR